MSQRDKLAMLAMLEQLDAPQRQQDSDQQAMAMRMQLAQQEQEARASEVTATTQGNKRRDTMSFISDLIRNGAGPEQFEPLTTSDPEMHAWALSLLHEKTNQGLAAIRPGLDALYSSLGKGKITPEAFHAAITSPEYQQNQRAFNAYPWSERNASLVPPISTTVTPGSGRAIGQTVNRNVTQPTLKAIYDLLPNSLNTINATTEAALGSLGFDVNFGRQPSWYDKYNKMITPAQ